MTPEAENAFLKTLEEEPPDTLLLLVTSDPTSLLPTTISRCARVVFDALTGDGEAALAMADSAVAVARRGANERTLGTLLADRGWIRHQGGDGQGREADAIHPCTLNQ